MVAAIEIDTNQVREGENYFLGKNEEAHVIHLSALQFSKTDVPKVIEFTSGPTFG